MEQSTQIINNHERVTKKLGRPKGVGIFTEEENKVRARQRSMLYYSLNLKKRAKTIRISCKNNVYNNTFLIFIFLNFHLNS